MPDEPNRNGSFTGVSHTVPFAVYYFVSDGINSVQFKNPSLDEKFLSEMYRPALGSAQPPIHEGKKTLSLGIKRLGREVAYICPCSVNITNEWS
jgi:hypothetical protein